MKRILKENVPISDLVDAICRAAQDGGLKSVVFGPFESHEFLTLIPATTVSIRKPWRLLSFLSTEYANITIERDPTNWFYIFSNSYFSTKDYDLFLKNISKYLYG